MQRRELLQLGAGALAAGSACWSGVGVGAGVSSADHIDAAAFHAMRRFAATPAGRIAYVERGSGPAALFFHGWPLNGFQWRGAIERLAPHRRCIAPDLIGLGYSEAPAEADVTPHAQARMMAGLLDALSIDSVDVICNDSGGVVAQLFLTLFPNRVRTILFTTTEVDENNPPPSFRPVIDLARRGLLEQYFVRAALANHDSARSGGLGAAYTNPANLTDECIETYLRPLIASPERIAQFNAYTIALDRNVLLEIAPQLAKSQAPARMLWSELAAPGFPVDSARWLDRTLPKSRGVRVIPGARLFFPEEMPDIVAEEATRLWSE